MAERISKEKFREIMYPRKGRDEKRADQLARDIRDRRVEVDAEVGTEKRNRQDRGY